MAVSSARVVDPDTVAGAVTVGPLPPGFVIDLGAPGMGLFDLFLGPPVAHGEFRDNVVVGLTRFVVDATVDVNDIFDDAFTEARGLPEWIEQRADRGLVGGRTQGATLQAGNYRDAAGRRLHTVTKYEAYQRGNVVYFLQCTGTTASDDVALWSSLVHTVHSARLDD
ncbi:hypothetical protein [Gordonia soli]|uniref:DUF1795 domain-containing protein n=1 Tax=Gordonia soli NBRC 108243 TaxID=1223545 RepID=M0QDT3_9ACTN|nr:hypothetical protein [Gordonia soli]GAC66758.1 hypothetical protein GS4_04_00150 [Gordonia soli NBRC 108243]